MPKSKALKPNKNTDISKTEDPKYHLGSTFKIGWEGPPIQQMSEKDTVDFISKHQFLLDMPDKDCSKSQLMIKIELWRLKYEKLSMGFQHLVDNKMPMDTKRLAWWAGTYRNLEDERDFYLNKTERLNHMLERLLPRAQYLQFQKQEMIDSDKLVDLMVHKFQMEANDLEKVIAGIKDRDNEKMTRRIKTKEQLKLEDNTNDDNS